jgi:hypothetical protein
MSPCMLVQDQHQLLRSAVSTFDEAVCLVHEFDLMTARKYYVSGWLPSRNTEIESEHSNQPEFRLVTEIPLSRSDRGMTSLLTSLL